MHENLYFQWHLTVLQLQEVSQSWLSIPEAHMQ